MSATAQSIAESLGHARLIVCVGPGGVGKTTFAAALGIQAARAGRRVFVLTIDPARRLADALGVRLDDGGASVASFGSPEIARRGEIHAAMLETSASWDAFVARVADDDATRARIAGNRVYRAFSRTLARSHAYVAMERLHHLLDERDATGAPRWDLVVLDTPPTRSAIDVLDAPSSLARFADERIVSALSGRGAARALGGAAARRGLALLMGAELAGELTSFLETFAPLRAGFARRATEVHATLRSESTAFVLVAAPLATTLDDARFLRDGLARRDIALAATVFNRAYPIDGTRPPRPIDAAATWDDASARAILARAGASDAELAAILGAARASRGDALALAAAARARIDAFLGDSDRAYALPALLREPCTIPELLEMIDAAVALSARAAAAR